MIPRGTRYPVRQEYDRLFATGDIETRIVIAQNRGDSAVVRGNAEIVPRGRLVVTHAPSDKARRLALTMSINENRIVDVSATVDGQRVTTTIEDEEL